MEYGRPTSTRDELITQCRYITSKCHNDRNPEYKNYGAKGISNQWQFTPGHFVNYCMALGFKKRHHLVVRINKKKNFEEGNIKFVDR